MIMNILRKIFYYSFSLLFCLRYLPVRQAIKVPILIWPPIIIGELHKGSIILNGKIKRSMIVWGFMGSEGRAKSKTRISIHSSGKLILGSGITIARGTSIIIDKGEISIGDNFFCNSDCFFSCNSRINIGTNNMYGWNINFNTTDGHHVYENGIIKPNNGPISIGNHVWIGSYCNLAKNVVIADGCVISQKSLLLNKFCNKNMLIAGIPAKELKENISWTGK